MMQNVVAISIDKVQTFLYYVFQANIQENQRNNKTLKTIINASKLISEQFYREVESFNKEYSFGKDIQDELLKCSGVFVFSTNLEKKLIEKKLKALFEKYYIECKGQLFLNYMCVERDINSKKDKLAIINKCKDNLKNCANKVILNNRELLFGFNKAKEENFLNKNDAFKDNKYTAFSENIDELIPFETKEYNKAYRIAIIKADLDGIGDLFKGIKDYNSYSSVSNVLSKYISIDYLHKLTEENKEKDKSFKLYPLYVAGDDIFFAVPTSKLITGVTICEKILDKINFELEDINFKSDINLKPISMSIGIEMSFNNEPIRYYYERVEQQLNAAKSKPRLDIPYLKISINNFIFYKYKKDKLKNLSEDVKNEIENKSNWGHFIHTVKLLNNYIDQLKNSNGDSYEAHHFFYSLLNKITDVNILNSDIKYSNAVLYHLMPKYIESANEHLMKAELLLLESLIKKFMIKESKENKLYFNDSNKKQFETYIRLLLLFCDSRFTEKCEDLEKGENKDNSSDFDIKRIRGNNFNKTIRYIYEENLYSLLKTLNHENTINSLRKNFVLFATYKSQSVKRVEIYRTLNISNSMFFRMKDVDKFKINAVADMLEAANSRTRKEVEDLEKESREKLKAPPKLFFDRVAFLNAASSGLWTKDYIDSLLILYKFNELSIKYKILTSGSKKQPKKNNKPKEQNIWKSTKYNHKKGARK